jgi:FkbM family methyltransferase
MSVDYLLPNAIVVPTLYGLMIVNRHDINQTNALFKSGVSPGHREIAMLAELLQRTGAAGTVLDIGANVGAFALGLASVLEDRGVVHAFEAQRQIFNMLAGSVALNNFENVYCHNLAISDREGKIAVPRFDYSKPLNFGSVEFGTANQLEKLTQEQGTSVEDVATRTIDSFEFQNVVMIKSDVEGMEEQVLAGMVDTIRRCRPLLYIEHEKSDKEALRVRIAAHKYEIHDNSTNFLCIPHEVTDRIIVVDEARK